MNQIHKPSFKNDTSPLHISLINQLNSILKTTTIKCPAPLRELLLATLTSIEEKSLSLLFYQRILKATTISFRDLLKALREEIFQFIEALNENSDETCRELIKDATKNLTELFNTRSVNSDEQLQFADEYENNEVENFIDNQFETENMENSEGIEPILVNSIIKDKKQKKIVDKFISIRDYDERVLNVQDTLLKKKEKKKTDIFIPTELLNLIEEYKQTELTRNQTLLEHSMGGEGFDEFEHFSNNQFIHFNNEHLSNNTDGGFQNFEEVHSIINENNEKHKHLITQKEFIFQEATHNLNNLEKSHAFLKILSDGNKNILEIHQATNFDSIYCRKI
ncbi:hypothetical protein CDIK_0524 [Cucumispora dikerogammari]|nr:hypothetical protein CDIK_0524 [Cucumispora dikerogammari]